MYMVCIQDYHWLPKGLHCFQSQLEISVSSGTLVMNVDENFSGNDSFCS